MRGSGKRESRDAGSLPPRKADAGVKPASVARRAPTTSRGGDVISIYQKHRTRPIIPPPTLCNPIQSNPTLLPQPDITFPHPQPRPRSRSRRAGLRPVTTTAEGPGAGLCTSLVGEGRRETRLWVWVWVCYLFLSHVWCGGVLRNCEEVVGVE